jgi:hypothetical protein
VSNASEDLPEPDTPVMAVSEPRGMRQLAPSRVWTRAPRISIAGAALPPKRPSLVSAPLRAPLALVTRQRIRLEEQDTLMIAALALRHVDTRMLVARNLSISLSASASPRNMR